MEKNPMVEFAKWYEKAVAEGLLEANAMALATADSHAIPSCRMVLLKHYDDNGFCFFTNYSSRKAKDLDQNRQASLTFWWKELCRQICVLGVSEKLSAEESERYFRSRSRGSQLGAVASHQDRVLANRAELEERYHELEQEYQGKEVPCPSYWGGYRIVPHQIEFWQGRANRLHDRFLYLKKEGAWVVNRLSP